MLIETHPVSPAEIQQTLNKMWETLESKNTTRASLFNLIFYTEKNARTPYVQKLAQKVVEKFPSRVIFISLDKQNQENQLKTEVSIISSHRGEYDVACDYIHLEASGNAQNRIPFVILPHIVPDLPVYLIWAEKPCPQDPLFKSLNQFVNRLIFDSETTENLATFTKDVLESYSTLGVDIADLNWARIESWRDLFSMVFYTEDTLQQMTRAKKISMTYNAKSSQFFCHTHIQAIYLQAWIACQLGWEFRSTRSEKDRIFFSYKSPVTEVEIELIALQEPKLPPGLILDIDIATLENCHFSFVRDKEQFHHICLKSSDPHKCELPANYILPKVESGHSLVKEVTHRGVSKHFLRVLNLLKTMQV